MLGPEVGVPALLAEPASQETQTAQDSLTTGCTAPVTHPHLIALWAGTS